ncbi:MAG: hypothetical protein R3F17_14360 [Planctomycetota bacterium]
MHAGPTDPPPTLGSVTRQWFPLALSWLCMALELPLVSAVISRLPSPDVQMAAVGSIAFPIALLIEGPVVMLLSASTALCRDRVSYLRVRRYALVMGMVLSAVHALVCLPALYDPIVHRLIDAPPAVARAAHPALWALIPWTLAIAYRRFHQGILIRTGRGQHVTQGTLLRLLTDCATLGLCSHFQVPGALTAGLALSGGVIAEALYVGVLVRPVLRLLPERDPGRHAPLDLRSFLGFYIPLALSPILGFLVMPIGAAAMARMPFSLESMAIWQVLHGVVFLPRSLALAYNEVVIRVSEDPRALPILMRFTRILGTCVTAALAVLALTPLGAHLLQRVFDLTPRMADLGLLALMLSIPQPGWMAGQSLHLGLLVSHRRTTAVTQSMLVFLVAASVLLAIATRIAHQPGLLYVAGAFTLAGYVQVLFLAWRSLGLRREILAGEPATPGH